MDIQMDEKSTWHQSHALSLMYEVALSLLKVPMADEGECSRHLP
jgi:hypothetical protein